MEGVVISVEERFDSKECVQNDGVGVLDGSITAGFRNKDEFEVAGILILGILVEDYLLEMWESLDVNFLGFRVSICVERFIVDCDGESKEKDPLVVCFVEMLIDFVPTVGGVSLAEAPAFKKAQQGAPANVSVRIQRVAGSAEFFGKVGDDEFERMLADVLKQNNVDNSGVCFGSKARTALAYVTLRADGEREFMFFHKPSTDMLLRESEPNKDFLKKASVFCYGSVSLIEKPCRSTEISAMKIVKKAGCILSYDPNLRLGLLPSPQAAKKEIMSIWDQAYAIKITEEEISFLTDGPEDTVAGEAEESLACPNGSSVKKMCHTEEEQADTGDSVTSTTGAGDIVPQRINRQACNMSR